MTAITSLRTRLETLSAPIRSGSNAAFLLVGADAWYVSAGHLDVFAVQIDSGKVVGPRTHLFRVPIGSALLPLALQAPERGAALLAVGNAESVLMRTPSAPLIAAASDDEPRALLEEWRDHLVALLPDAESDGADPWLAARTADVSIDADGALQQLHTAIAQITTERLARDADVDATRTRGRSIDSAAAYTGGWVQLWSVLPGVRPVRQRGGATGANGLLAAARMVGRSQGIDIKSPSPLALALHPRDPVAAIARATRMRSRAVRLQGDWWKQDGGAFLGCTAEGSRPIALLPLSHRKYECYDPATDERTVVTQEVAAGISPQGFVFYRSAGYEPVTLGQLFARGLARCRRDVALFALFSAASAILSLATPIAMSAIFNDIIPSAERGQLLQLVGLLVLFAVTSAILSVSGYIAILRIEAKLGADLMLAVWDRLLALPAKFFRSYSAGNLATRAMAVESIRQTLSGATMVALVTGTMSMFQFGFLFHVNAGLALVSLGMIAVMMAVTVVSSYLQLRDQRRVTSMQAKQSGLVLQLLTNIAKLRVAGAERHAFNLWARQFAEQRKLQFRIRVIGNAYRVFVVAFPVLANMVIFATALPLVGEPHGLRTGDFLAFLAAFGLVTGGMLSVSGTLVSALGAIPFHEQLKPILAALPESTAGQVEPGILRGELELQHVAFRYADDTPHVLRNLTFRAAAGEFIALVGPSGTGKSTVLRLMLGFEKPESGTVYYDGQDLENLDKSAVRSQLGVVLQSGQLMPGDIFSNIVGASRATVEDAWEAARMAGLEEDIRGMPMGMQTVVGEGQSTLSGGQKQRLMIARALVRRPRILFFDEATSALDNRTQASVSASLDQLKVTRIVVAHRLSTIMHADRIYVMRDGEVIESGNYETLMALNGTFAELAHRQLA